MRKIVCVFVGINNYLVKSNFLILVCFISFCILISCDLEKESEKIVYKNESIEIQFFENNLLFQDTMNVYTFENEQEYKIIWEKGNVLEVLLLNKDSIYKSVGYICEERKGEDKRIYMSCSYRFDSGLEAGFFYDDENVLQFFNEKKKINLDLFEINSTDTLCLDIKNIPAEAFDIMASGVRVKRDKNKFYIFSCKNKNRIKLNLFFIVYGLNHNLSTSYILEKYNNKWEIHIEETDRVHTPK